MNDRQLIEDLLSALEYHTEQTRPIQFSNVAIEAAREYLRKPEQPAQQEPVATLYGSLPVYDKPAREPLTDEETSKLFDSLVDEMLDHSYQGSHDSAEKAANEIRRMYKAAHGITKGNT